MENNIKLEPQNIEKSIQCFIFFSNIYRNILSEIHKKNKIDNIAINSFGSWNYI